MTRLATLVTAAVMSLTCYSGGAQSVTLLPTGASTQLRWMDIGNNYFSAAFRGSFLYDDATVTADALVIDCPDGNARPAISLVGSGLKPNFAYQLKLEGKPTYYYGADGDDWANEQLGYAGRWWLTVYNTRTGEVVDAWNCDDDADYEYWKSRGFRDNKRKREYVFKGYLLFGFLITDPSGNITDSQGNPDLPVLVDSSLHVLWKESQDSHYSKRAEDTESVVHVISANGDSYGYDLPPTGTEAVYGESQYGWENTRALPGELVLPDGDYNVALIMTEETFHNGLGDGDDPLGGFWQTVLAASTVEFTIGTPPPPPPPPPELGSLSGTVLIGGGPLRKGAVDLLGAEGQGDFSAKTNPKGYYTIVELPFGLYDMWCDGTLFGPVVIDGDVVLDISI